MANQSARELVGPLTIHSVRRAAENYAKATHCKVFIGGIEQPFVDALNALIESDRKLAVAGAYLDCAQELEALDSVPMASIAISIRAMTPADAQAALDTEIRRCVAITLGMCSVFGRPEVDDVLVKIEEARKTR